MSDQDIWPIGIKWVGGYQFLGSDDEGHALIMDLPKDAGEGLGFSPRKLLLIALGGCTAMDMVMLLRKQKQDLRSLRVYVTGEEAPLAPHYFTEIQLRYHLEGKNLDEEVVKEAIRLSDERYCSVGANLKDRSKIITSYEIEKVE